MKFYKKYFKVYCLLKLILSAKTEIDNKNRLCFPLILFKLYSINNFKSCQNKIVKQKCCTLDFYKLGQLYFAVARTYSYIFKKNTFAVASIQILLGGGHAFLNKSCHQQDITRIINVAMVRHL